MLANLIPNILTLDLNAFVSFRVFTMGLKQLNDIQNLTD